MAIEYLQQILITFNNKLGNATPKSVKTSLSLIESYKDKSTKHRKNRILKVLNKAIHELVEMDHSNDEHFERENLDDLVDSLVRQTEELEKGYSPKRIKEKLYELGLNRKKAVRFMNSEEFIKNYSEGRFGGNGILIDSFKGFLKRGVEGGWGYIADVETDYKSSTKISTRDDLLRRYSQYLKESKNKQEAYLKFIKYLRSDESTYKYWDIEPLFKVMGRAEKYPKSKRRILMEFSRELKEEVSLKNQSKIIEEFVKNPLGFQNKYDIRGLITALCEYSTRHISKSFAYEMVAVFNSNNLERGDLYHSDWIRLNSDTKDLLGVIIIVKNRKILQDMKNLLSQNPEKACPLYN